MSREFDRDLDEYLQARKRAKFPSVDLSSVSGFFKKMVPKPVPKVDMPSDVEVYHEQPTPEKPKQPFFSRMFKKETDSQELARLKLQVEDALTDLKEIAKISLGVVKKLPDELLSEFKHSADFEKLKTVLRKHELIK